MTIFSATIRNNVVILFCESSGRSATIFFSASLHALKIVVAHQCQERDVTRADFQQRFLAQHGVILLQIVTKFFQNCCPKNLCCKSSPVTLPLDLMRRHTLSKDK